MLDERALLLERRDGKGMRIALDSIQRVRHHHTPFTPPGITWIGVITLILAARVLSGSIQLYALAIGALTIFTWLIGRRPTLCIDTKAGDRHVLHGRDSLLLRIQMMVNRLCEGKSLAEAREGLDELIRHSNYPSVTPHESVQAEAAIIADQIVAEATPLDLPDTYDEADLEQALKNIFHGETAQVPEPQPAQMMPVPTAHSATEDFGSTSAGDHAGRSLLDRARTSLEETRAAEDPAQQRLEGWTQPWEKAAPVAAAVGVSEAQSAYERTWGREDPTWYAEKDEPTSRISAAASDARAEGDSIFSGGVFDALDADATTDTGIFGSMFDSPAAVEAPAPTPAPLAAPHPAVQQPAPNWSGAAIRGAAAPTALATTLPEPTFHAVRAECTPGVVAQARMHAIPEAVPQPAPEAPVHEANLAAFPALSAMVAATPGPRLRARTREGGRFAKLAKRSLNALFRTEGERPKRRMARPVEVRDDYAEVYGDADGFEDGQYREMPLRSGQILRLRADQDHQGEVGGRVRDLLRSTGGALDADEAEAMIERLAASGDLAPIASLLEAAEAPALSFGALASTSPPKEAYGHHGISRLG